MACKHTARYRRYKLFPTDSDSAQTEILAKDYNYWQLSDADRAIADARKHYGPCTEECEKLMQEHAGCERVESFLEE